MADEPQAQAQAPPEGQSEPQSAPAFDWDAFWGDSGQASASESPADQPPTSAAAVASAADDADAAAVAAELKALRERQAQLDAKYSEMERTQTVQRAVDAWKQNASPAELSLAPLLERCQTVQELKETEVVIKQMATRVESDYAERERIALSAQARKMAADFGMPVAPEAAKPPALEEAKQALGEGDIQKGAELLVKDLW